MNKIALVDCNNFFASCERVFQPYLRGKALVILSNNDGCIIARSNEAKALGIPMGAPFFKWKSIIEQHSVHVFSSNFRLYGDMSRRVMGILQQMVEDTEVYSVDEAFVNFDEKLAVVSDLYGHYMKNTVYQYTGLPVSVGIATSKVLAKIATWIVKEDQKKSHPKYNGVFDLTQLSVEQQDEILKRVPIGEVWGIGSRLRKKYIIKGFPTAYHLKYSDLGVVRKSFHILGERVRQELNGIPVLALENTPTHCKSIMSSRSFGKPIIQKSKLREALVSYIATAANKLIKQDLLMQDMKIYIRSSYNKTTECCITRSEYILLPSPTNHIPTLVKAMSTALDEIYLPGISYKKAGVVFSNLTANHSHQTSLFSETSEQKKTNDSAINILYHKLRKKHGKNKLLYASEGLKKSWLMQSNLRSKEFTTKWSDVMVVR